MYSVSAILVLVIVKLATVQLPFGLVAQLVTALRPYHMVMGLSLQG